jgi:arsenate reductase-like glutaredoxin family protein
MNNDLRYDTYPDYDGMSREKWIEILQTIQDGFKTFDSVHEFEYAEMDENQRKVVDEKRHEAFVLLEKYFQSLWH